MHLKSVYGEFSLAASFLAAVIVALPSASAQDTEPLIETLIAVEALGEGNAAANQFSASGFASPNAARISSRTCAGPR